MRLIGAMAGLCVVAVAVAGCGGSSNGGGGGAAKSGSSGPVVAGGTFTFAMTSDPGNLDPQASAASNLFQISQFAYDHLVNPEANGKTSSGLATSWQVSGATVTMTMHKAITCSDGSPFTASDAAANLNYIADPKNKSPFVGVFLPTGAHATASGDKLTITSPKAAPFVLDGLANIPMVCAKGMQNRKLLAQHTDGTGPYQLSQAVASDHYTYTKRKGYTWGPGGATTATKGMPDKIVVKIIANETTAANLLLSGGLNAATVVGADAARLEAAHLFSASTSAVYGEMWFNQSSGRPASDPAVRHALTDALDLSQLQKVLTSNRGSSPTTFAAIPPVGCPGNSIKAALPTQDLAKAKQLLDAAGWKAGSGGIRSKGGKQLALTFVYNTELGSGGSAAAELAVQQWKQLGAKITTKPQNETALVQTAFSTGDFDIVWESLNVSTPDQLVPFMSGTVAPKGTNFAHINNAGYNAAVAKAATLSGTAGCSQWLKAETNLVTGADVVPFANQVAKTFGKSARFDFLGDLVPTSIRMLAH